MADERGTDEVVLREIARVFEPLVSAAKAAEETGPGEIRALIAEMGLDELPEGQQEMLEERLGATSEAFERVTEQVRGEGDGDLAATMESIRDVVTTVAEMNDARIDHPHIDAIGDLVIDFLLVRYLETYYPGLYATLRTGRIITDRPGRAPEDIHFARLGEFFTDPNEIPREVFRWGSEEFIGFLVVYYLRDVLWDLGLKPQLKEPNPEYYRAFGVEPDLDASDGDTSGEEGEADSPPRRLPGLDDELQVPIAHQVEGGAVSTAGFIVLPLPATADELPGLAIIPYGVATFREATDSGGDWTGSVDISAEIDGYAFVIRPGDLAFVKLGEEGTVGEFSGTATLRFDPSSAGSEWTTVLGEPEGSRLAAGSIAARARVEFDGSDIVFDIGLPTTGRIVVDPEDLGGFLKKVLPADGIDFDFELAPGWASDGGFYLETGGTLEISLPQNAELGPITLTEIYLAATLDGDTTTITAAVSGDVTLGPVMATVGRVGIAADIALPEDRDGNFGPLDLDLGFEPPSQIGLSIDSGPVTGGGYLEFEPEYDRYAGILHLQFSQISITAIGLITTSLPGGEDGYSLLILITAQDLGIDIGMGFTLDGIGGLIGVHRSMQPKPLQRAVRTGSLKHVLFPEDPIAHAQEIISDLRSIFPPTKDQFVIGPMLRVGWGKPTLITADIGVVLQLPKVRVAILGRISAALPDEAAPLVVLNMDALGLILPDEQRMSLDATLYDSRLLVFNLSGQMAMRSRWGDDPRFLLSVGGFHPAFDPPGEFPDVDRLKVSLSEGPFHVEITGYFALTSNTVQTGAHARVQLGSGKWKIAGHLGFDALIRWAPEFGFRADFIAEIEVCAGFCFSLGLEGTLMGVSPYRIKAKIKFSLGLFEVKIPVEASFGPDKEEEGLAPAKVLPELLEDLQDPHSWETRLPADTTDIVTLRDVEPEDGQVLGHPLGTFAVRQETVPLELTIDTYGNAKPSDYRRFEISEVRLYTDSGAEEQVVADPDDATDHFAPGEYLDMSDSEQLEANGYERFTAGRRLTSETPHFVVDSEGTPWNEYEAATRETTLAYETSIVDEESGNHATPRAELGQFLDKRPQEALIGVPAETAAMLSSVSGAAQADTRKTGLEAFKPDPAVLDGGDTGPAEGDQAPKEDLSVEVDSPDRSYVISPTEALGSPAETDLDVAPDERLSRTEADQLLQEHLAENPEDEGAYQVVNAHRLAVGGEGG